MLGILYLVTIVAISHGLPTDVGKSGEKLYKYHEKILEAGYPVEVYDVVTEDGYILELIRIPHGKDGDDGQEKTPVFLMHGLSDSPKAFIDLGPDYGLAYILADHGADVWMGNARGVANSRRHVSLNPDDEKEKFDFFDFTFEEIGLIDLPTMIDYVLEKTGHEKLYYIGHSQGGTVFLILNSLKPEYNEKFLSVHLLAPVGYQRNFPTTQLKLTALSTDLLYSLALSLGNVEVLGPNWGDHISNLEHLQACSEVGVCSRSSLEDIIKDILNPSEILPGFAIKQAAHYGQNVRDSRFRRWNFGILRNLSKYGSISPPEYDLSKITAEVTMHYTINDMLLGEQDVLDMANVLPNASVRKVARDDFTHTDFVMAEDAKELVINYIVQQFTASAQ